MAHKKGQGSSRNGRDSNPQFRGVKRFGGQFVKTGTIILRQCGTPFLPGLGVGFGQAAVGCGQGIQLGNDIGVTALELVQFRPGHGENLFSSVQVWLSPYYNIFSAARSRK